MKPEKQLLCYCLRAAFGKTVADDIKEVLSFDINWNSLLERAQKEKIAPLLYVHIQNQSLPLKMPSVSLARLKEIYYTSSTKNILLFEQLKTILESLQKAKIKTIVLKGAFLAEHIYENIALRPMSDVDILIKKQDLFQANDVLQSLDYITPPYYEAFAHKKNPTCLNTIMYTSRNPFNVDVHLHWHLVNATQPLGGLINRFDMQRIWDRMFPIKVGGADTFTLLPEHLIIYLAHHNFKHFFSQLIYLLDMVKVLEYYQDNINWEFLTEEARRFGLLFTLYCALHFVSEFLHCPIPEISRVKLETMSLSQKIIFRTIRRDARHDKLFNFAALLMTQGARNKLRFISRMFFPPQETLAHNLNLSPQEINFYHYCQRLYHNITRFFS